MHRERESPYERVVEIAAPTTTLPVGTFQAFIDRGAFAAVYVPAFQAKDVALALDAKKGELPAEKQRALSPAVNRLVRTSYLLDAFGDLGNKQQIVEAYSRFASAVQEINGAFAK